MAIPDAPAPIVTDITDTTIVGDLGASNEEYDREIGISTTDPLGGDPDTVLETIPGTTTTYTWDSLTPETTYWIAQRFTNP